ncbi:flagellar biosynthetic protein FliR [Helicobacter sp. 13S00401-1]|uniref:flagellar biosynthetic protein FliR n=1 Tax=Helicobacter sp. 13S00401-1 TaxID=1905758 RepID=UPI000BA6A6F6|nr:flagellar biosynthetic protein FliR [Helicobacter sp. 13S00401-1]PAF51129.1 flagellar biosynthetic protein FliR [Helicobacter sp. 13S00401-1]
MLEFLGFLTQDNIVAFLLLLLRFGAILAFFPFFDNQLVPISVRAALAFVLTVTFFPLVHVVVRVDSMSELIMAGFFEIVLGFICGLALQIVFSAVIFAGDMISFSMGLTLASSYDPMSGGSKPVIAQVIILLMTLMALHFNFHYLFLDMIARTLNSTPLGGFVLSNDILNYFVKAFGHMFVLGFMLAFPVLAIILFSDIIFGMIMKTHPQFNLLVIGFPVKIAIGLVALIVIIPSMVAMFKDNLGEVFKALWKILT